MPEQNAWATVAWFARQDAEMLGTTARSAAPPGVPQTVAGALVHLSQALLDLRDHKADDF